MHRWKTFFTSTLGSKTTMAVTGIALLVFVIVHLLGNLQIFLGQDAINAYAQRLRALGPLLWIARIGLLLVLGLHVHAAFVLTRRSRAARPVPYRTFRTVRTTYAARTMVVSGVLVLLYVTFHLLHFTLGQVQPDAFALTDPQGRHDVHGMMIAAFRSTPIATVYAVAQAVLALHISHGASSVMQTLGVTHPAVAPAESIVGPVLALLIFLGYMSIPAAILLGYVS